MQKKNIHKSKKTYQNSVTIFFAFKINKIKRRGNLKKTLYNNFKQNILKQNKTVTN